VSANDESESRDAGVADGPAPGGSDSLDDLAAFLMHRTGDPEVTDEQRYRTFALVSAYQDGDNPPEIQAEMREAALKFAGHPDYRPEWRPQQ
jgi:multidrug efflux pump subunit AcrB